MNHQYYLCLKDFQTKIMRYVTEVLKLYGNELQLYLGDYNLLTHDKNCLESSTVFGYIIEEFLVSKLEIYSQHHTETEYVIQRPGGSTTASSYDCFSVLDAPTHAGGIKALVNIKANKKNNNAIAAINKIYNDYVLCSPKQPKCYLVLKVHYHIAISESDNERKIFIDDISSFFLEEIDFSRGHRQDRRSWSAEYNANSGRLQASSAFRNLNKVPEQDISYENTKAMVEHMFTHNH